MELLKDMGWMKKKKSVKRKGASSKELYKKQKSFPLIPWPKIPSRHFVDF